MKKLFRKNIRTYLIGIFIVVVVAVVISRVVAFAADTARTNSKDQTKVETYARYGGVVPDSVINLGFKGTGFAVDPTSFEDIVAAVAAEYVFGITLPGVENYSGQDSSILDQMAKANSMSSNEKNLIKQMSFVMLGGMPTKFEEDNNDAGQELDEYGDLPNLALSTKNSTGAAVLLQGVALGRKDQLRASTDITSAFPERAGEREFGKNSSSGSPFKDISGEIITPAIAKNTGIAITSGGLGQLAMIASNPDGGDAAVNNGLMPTVSGKSDAQKKVTSAQVTGDGAQAGKTAEIAGLTDKNPGAPVGNLNDIINLALQNSSNQINNYLNSLGNAQNHFPNGRLNQLQNLFPQNNFQNQLTNRFPGTGGGGGGGGGTGGGGGASQPPVTPTQPDATNECKTENAVLTQQEVVDVADFLGLPLEVQRWTVSYFKAQQLIGQSVYLGNNTSQTILGTYQLGDPQSCVWVTYAPEEKRGVFMSDIRSENATKFLFRMP